MLSFHSVQFFFVHFFEFSFVMIFFRFSSCERRLLDALRAIWINNLLKNPLSNTLFSVWIYYKVFFFLLAPIKIYLRLNTKWLETEFQNFACKSNIFSYNINKKTREVEDFYSQTDERIESVRYIWNRLTVRYAHPHTCTDD